MKTTINREQEIEQREDELLEEERGYTTAIEIAPPGGDSNIEWNAVVIEMAKIDNDTIVYRYSDDSHNGEWTIGTIEDAVNAAIAEQEQLA